MLLARVATAAARHRERGAKEGALAIVRDSVRHTQPTAKDARTHTWAARKAYDERCRKPVEHAVPQSF
eukprot:7077810-Prymnesium_polylepis.1